MNILAIESTGPVAGAAIVNPDRIIAEFSINNKLTHSQVLLPLINNMLTAAEFDKNRIDLIACSSGPGSFTGLRIGAAVAKGLAFGLGKKIVPVATLDVLAYNNLDGKIAVPIMDARRGQVYTALYYCFDGKIDRQTEYMACDFDEILSIANGYADGKVTFLGDGVAVFREKILAAGLDIAPAQNMFQKASNVGAIALDIAHTAVDAADFAPFYIRSSQAEREFGA